MKKSIIEFGCECRFLSKPKNNIFFATSSCTIIKIQNGQHTVIAEFSYVIQQMEYDDEMDEMVVHLSNNTLLKMASGHELWKSKSNDRWAWFHILPCKDILVDRGYLKGLPILCGVTGVMKKIIQDPLPQVGFYFISSMIMCTNDDDHELYKFDLEQLQVQKLFVAEEPIKNCVACTNDLLIGFSLRVIRYNMIQNQIMWTFSFSDPLGILAINTSEQHVAVQTKIITILSMKDGAQLYTIPIPEIQSMRLSHRGTCLFVLEARSKRIIQHELCFSAKQGIYACIFRSFISKVMIEHVWAKIIP